MEDIRNASIAKGFCECCGDPVEDTKFTLCTEHYKAWIDTHDYKNICSINSSRKYRDLHGIGDVYENRIQCKHCSDIITSNNRHDFKFCSCGKVAIDGGSAYSRRLGNIEDYIDLTTYFTHLT